MINKSRFRISNDKKVLHKIGKRWVTVSALTLALLGGGAVASSTMTHADTINNQPKLAIVTNNLNKALSKSANSSNTSSSTASASSKMPASSNTSSVSSSGTIQSASTNSTSNKPSSVGSIEDQANQLHKHMLNNSMNTLNLGTTNQQKNSWNFVQNGIRNKDFDNNNLNNQKELAKPAVHFGGLGATRQLDEEQVGQKYPSDNHWIVKTKGAPFSSQDWNVPLGWYSDNSVGDWKNGPGQYCGMNYRYSPSLHAVEFMSGTPKNYMNQDDLASLMNFANTPVNGQNVLSVKFTNNVNLRDLKGAESAFGTEAITSVVLPSSLNAHFDDQFMFEAGIPAFVGINSSNTDLSGAGLPTMYKEVGGADANGNPYTETTPANFSNVSAGAFVPTKNPKPVIYSDIYSSIDGKTAPSSTTKIGDNSPEGWAYVTTSDKPSYNPITKNGHVLVAPEDDGLIYKYDKANNSIEFTGGIANSDLSNFTSMNHNMLTISNIKFDNNTNFNKLKNISDMFQVASNPGSDSHSPLSIILPTTFDTRNVNEGDAATGGVFPYGSDITITIQSPDTVFSTDTLDYPINTAMYKKDNSDNYTSSSPTSLGGGMSHIGTWVGKPNIRHDTDTVAFYTKNGNDNVLVKKATVSGADGSSVDISKDVPSNYQLANGNPKITLTANTTDNIELNLKDGQSITNPYIPEKVTPDSANADIQYTYNKNTVVNSDKTDYKGNNYQATDAGDNGTTISDKNDKGLPDGWHLAPTNTKTKSDTTYVKYDNGKHPVAIDPNHVSDNVIYQYNGKNVNNGYQLGSHSFGGNDYRATQAGNNGVDIKQANATGLRNGYTLVNTDNNIQFDGQTKYIPVKPNQISDKGTLNLIYKESNGRTDKTVTLHPSIKGNVDDTLTLAKPLDYAEDNYTVPNSDFTWTIKPSNNEPSKTFTYNAPTAGNVTIQYYDTATNHHLTQFDKTLTSSDMEKAPYNINWIVGNQIKLGIKGSNDKAIDVLQAPAGYHFAKNYPVETVTLPEAKKGLTLHVGLMLMAKPNKPASNANQPTSSTSVTPSSNSNTSSSSSAVAPSSSSMPSSASTNSESISMNSSEVSNLASEIGANIVIRPNITDKTVDDTQNDTVLDDMASEISINNQELSNLANRQQSNYSAPTTTNANPATVNITKHTTPKAINHGNKLPMKNHYYVYSPKNIILYGKHGAIKINRRKGFTGKIMKITKFHGKKAFVIRWHHKNFIVNAKHTRNAYIQPKEYNHYAHGIIKHATIKLRKNAIIYKSIHFNKHNAKRTVKAGNEFTVIGIKSFGEKGYERTRFILSNGLIITANKNYVKFI